MRQEQLEMEAVWKTRRNYFDCCHNTKKFLPSPIFSTFKLMTLIWARCDPVPLIWGYRSPLTARSNVGYRKRSTVQLWASLRDVGLMVPTELGHWTPFCWAPPPGQVGRSFPWALHKGQPLYIHTWLLWSYWALHPICLTICKLIWVKYCTSMKQSIWTQIFFYQKVTIFGANTIKNHDRNWMCRQ